MRTFGKPAPAIGSAFTLIEIMVVVGLIGMILAMSAPSLYRLYHKEGLEKILSDFDDICRAARGRAILGNQITKIVFHPLDRTCAVEGGAPPQKGFGAPVLSTQFPDTITIEMLDVNLREYKDADSAEVRFFPNGTSDEMTLILLSDKNARKKVSLEVTTGLPIIEDFNP